VDSWDLKFKRFEDPARECLAACFVAGKDEDHERAAEAAIAVASLTASIPELPDMTTSLLNIVTVIVTGAIIGSPDAVRNVTGRDSRTVSEINSDVSDPIVIGADPSLQQRRCFHPH
jgi:hypothetical protein